MTNPPAGIVATLHYLSHQPCMQRPMKPGQRAITELRRMIASGELRDGERIAEIPTAAFLGMSRMPIRTALRQLEQEGLVVPLGARGYAARTATAAQVSGAIEVRGVLEGLAARCVAMRHDRAAIVVALRRCMAKGDAIFAGGALGKGDVERYYDYNLTFHRFLVGESRNEAIGVALARNDHLPFGAAFAMTLDWHDPDWIFTHLRTAHQQHDAVVMAIEGGDADTAERLMRDHAQVSLESVRSEPLGSNDTHGVRINTS